MWERGGKRGREIERARARETRCNQVARGDGGVALEREPDCWRWNPNELNATGLRTACTGRGCVCSR